MDKCSNIAEPCLPARESLQAGRGGLLPPPVGTSDWARFSRDSYCVDKTLILKFGMAFYKKNLVVCRDLP